MNAIGVIPARWASSRFEGKVLADINGKPLIQHVWERASKAKLLDDLIIACDDERVIKAVQRFGGKACYTSPKQPSGTDRIAEVVNPLDVKIVVNIQGDEPLIKGIMIDTLVSAFQEDETLKIATLVKKITNLNDINDPNVVKVVFDRKGYALYFSRSPIPYIRDRDDQALLFGQNIPTVSSGKTFIDYYKHIGLYAYSKEFLFTYTKLPFSKLERSEKLEQLRVLESGFRIKTLETDMDTVGVDTFEDLEKVKTILSLGGNSAV